MMNILKGLAKATVATVTLPVAIAADVITVGGAITPRGKPYTPEHAAKIMDGIEEATK